MVGAEILAGDAADIGRIDLEREVDLVDRLVGAAGRGEVAGGDLRDQLVLDVDLADGGRGVGRGDHHAAVVDRLHDVLAGAGVAVEGISSGLVLVEPIELRALHEGLVLRVPSRQLRKLPLQEGVGASASGGLPEDGDDLRLREGTRPPQ